MIFFCLFEANESIFFGKFERLQFASKLNERQIAADSARLRSLRLRYDRFLQN